MHSVASTKSNTPSERRVADDRAATSVSADRSRTAVFDRCACECGETIGRDPRGPSGKPFSACDDSPASMQEREMCQGSRRGRTCSNRARMPLAPPPCPAKCRPAGPAAASLEQTHYRQIFVIGGLPRRFLGTLSGASVSCIVSRQPRQHLHVPLEIAEY